MNLIEELGGYECAKAEHDDPMYEDGELYTIKATGTRFFKHNLAEELLEYRRANNIYDVGDRVVTTKKSQLTNIDDVGTVSDINSFGYLFINGSRNGYDPDNFRHATDAEIAAGHRL